MIFLLASCNRNCRFVAPKYYRNEDCSVRVNINGNQILFVMGSVTTDATKNSMHTYALSPSPVPRHEVAISSFAILKLTVWNVVDVSSEIGVGKDVVDDLPRIAVPELVLGCHPFGRGSMLWIETLILNGI